eukprot:571188_1
MAHFAMESPNGPNQTFTVFLKYQESVKKVHVPIVSTISELYRITKEKFQLFHAQIFVLYVNDREFGCDCELEQMEQLWDGAIVTIHGDKSNPIRSDSIQRNAIQSIDHKSSAPQDQTSNQYDAFLNKLQGRSIAEIVRSLSNADSLQAFIWDITGQPGAYSQLSIEPGMDKLFQAFQSIATDLRKTMFANIPTLSNIYEELRVNNNVNHVDYGLIAREQERLQHYVYDRHRITNYNPYRAPKDVRLAIEKKKRREKAIAEQLRQDMRFANNQHEHRPSFPVHVPKNNNANQHGHHREGRRNRSRNMNSHSRALSRSRSRSRRHRIKREEESKYY